MWGLLNSRTRLRTQIKINEVVLIAAFTITHAYFYNEEGQRWLYLPSPCCIFSTPASFSRAARPFPPGPFLRVESYKNVGQFLLPFIIAAPSLSNPLNSFSHHSTIVFFFRITLHSLYHWLLLGGCFNHLNCRDHVIARHSIELCVTR